MLQLSRRVLAVATPLLLVLPSLLGGQVAPPPASNALPSVSLGWAPLAYGHGGDQVYGGMAARVGVYAFSYFGAALVAERWPNLSRAGPGPAGLSLQLQGSFYPIGVRRVAPYLSFAVGYFSELLADGATDVAANGVSRAVGLGVQGTVWQGLGLRLEQLIRFDGPVENSEWRVLFDYSPVRPSRVPGGSRVMGTVYAMAPVRGPWRFAEPAYGLRTLSPVTERDAVALDVAVLHWRILDRDRPYGYRWDTRAALLMPTWRRTHLTGTMTVHTRLGPAVTTMVEGPDQGVLPGAYVDAGLTVDFGLVKVEGGVGWLWLSRTTSASTPGSDQHAVIAHVALGF